MRILDSDLVIGGFRRDPEDWVDRRWVAVHQMTPAERRIAVATTADAHALSVLGRYVIVPGVTTPEDEARIRGLDALAAFVCPFREALDAWAQDDPAAYEAWRRDRRVIYSDDKTRVAIGSAPEASACRLCALTRPCAACGHPDGLRCGWMGCQAAAEERLPLPPACRCYERCVLHKPCAWCAAHGYDLGSGRGCGGKRWISPVDRDAYEGAVVASDASSPRSSEPAPRQETDPSEDDDIDRRPLVSDEAAEKMMTMSITALERWLAGPLVSEAPRWARVELMGRTMAVGRLGTTKAPGGDVFVLQELHADGSWSEVFLTPGAVYRWRYVTEDEARRALLPSWSRPCTANCPSDTEPDAAAYVEALCCPGRCRRCGHTKEAHAPAPTREETIQAARLAAVEALETYGWENTAQALADGGDDEALAMHVFGAFLRDKTAHPEDRRRHVEASLRRLVAAYAALVTPTEVTAEAPAAASDDIPF